MNITPCPPDSGGISPASQRTIRRALTLLERHVEKYDLVRTDRHVISVINTRPANRLKELQPWNVTLSVN